MDGQGFVCSSLKMCVSQANDSFEQWAQSVTLIPR